MKQTCEFKKGADIMQTVPNLSVNINDGIMSGTIVDTCVPASFNGQNDVSEVGSRIKEPFDVIEFERSYTKLRKRINDSKDEE